MSTSLHGLRTEQQNPQQTDSHHWFTLIHEGGLFWAPIKDAIKTALDVGTGSGIWAMDFADQFPSTSVVGTDISPIQPAWVPPNLRFEIL